MIVRVKTRYPSHRGTWDVQEYAGELAPSFSWMNTEQIAMKTGNPNFPVRVLEKKYILEMFEDKGKKIKVARKKNQDKTFKITGSKGDKYLVVLSNNIWSCPCKGFGFRRSCKHVDEAKAKSK